MKELIEKGSLSEAHPSQWAPFIVVGEDGTSTPAQLTATPDLAMRATKAHPSRAKAVDWRTKIWRQ